MPTRSLRSPVLRWPDAARVDSAARGWAASEASADSGIERIGYFGSYARGDWGVGSGLDLVVVLDTSTEPFERRGLAFQTSELPVPADVVVYTAADWREVSGRPGFGRTVAGEVVWVYSRAGVTRGG